MPIIRQDSFAGGELSPSLWARTGLDRYRIGARQLKNFIVTPSGSAANRPGGRLCEYELISDLVAVRTSSNQCGKSTTGASWAADTLPSTASRYAIACSGYRFVTCGGASAVWEVSDDNGDTWATKTKPSSNLMYGVLWDGTNFVCCGLNGNVGYSDDNGETWQEQTLSPGQTLLGIAAVQISGSNIVVAAGNYGASFYSKNHGVNWTYQALPRAIAYPDIASDGSASFIAVANNYIARSTNGISWTEQALSGNHSAVIFAGGRWWIFDSSSDQAHWSTDGTTWTTVTLPVTMTAHHPAWTGQYIVVPGIAGNGFLYGPADGSDWNAVSYSGDWRGVASKYAAAELGHPRLIPFVFSDEQALVLEFRGGVIRFIEDGAYVDSGGSPYEVATPYLETDLPRLKYAQLGNIITLTHPEYAPRELERTATSPLTFTLTAIDFDIPITGNIGSVLTVTIDSSDVGYPGDIQPKVAYQVTMICQSLDGSRIWETSPDNAYYWLWFANVYDRNLSNWDVGTTYALSDQVNWLGVSWRSMQNGNVGNTPTFGISTYWDQMSVQSYQKVHFQYVHEIAWGPDAPHYSWSPPSNCRVLAWCLYRASGHAESGLIGITGDGDTGALTENALVEPDYLQRPPKGENPFEIYDEDGDLVRTEEPTCVAYHDGRLIFGGTAERPNYLFASRLGDWYNFDQYPIVKADDSILFGLAGRRYEEIRSIVPGRSLLVFTSGSEWAVDGGQPGQPITPTSLSARQRTERGSTWLDALKVGDDHVLFVQRKGTVVRDLAYDGEKGTYQNSDLSLFSHHLFAGKTVVDWCWQEDPWSVVWVVLDDGTLVSLTFLPEHRVIAWVQHDLGGDGVAEAICSIPEGEEDVVYLLVRRGYVRSIERLATRVVDDVDEGIFLDSCLSYTFSTPTTAVTGLDHLEDQQVYALADGAVQGPFTVSSGAITLTTAASRVHVGLKYNADFGSLDAPPGEGKTRIRAVKQAWVELEASAGRIQAGPDFDHLETWSGNEAEESAATDGLVTGQARILTTSRWGHGGRVCVRQSDPLPCTILAVSREVEYGER